LLHLVRKPAPFVFTPATKQLIRGCFQQRRKQIASLLRERLPDHGKTWIEELVTAGLGPQARPEEIPVTLWMKLATT
jgi:16S rRNA (adenine1518-N6/adenine1519-N6)-dimethyltransferase